MPSDPFTSRFGNLDGSTVGSLTVPSKLSIMSTVSLSRSISRSLAILESLASV
jgi:hypothetical protein